ncbi:MAG: glutamine synthetase [Gammaproteobacteria bacterium RIFCSPHIGHO2_12_FULL_41_15]|nr:MAG: glutamine synthetase [Gammaproteobacteria bacterium RIFCSPHIGHO2_12_FULL_41_15]
MLSQVDYIWMDGAKPTKKLRSKKRIVFHDDKLTLNQIPQWSYDGSSTYQSDGSDSDLILDPVCLVKDPVTKGENNYLVMCEVFAADGSPHPTNTRAKLRHLIAEYGEVCEPWFGFEQEYTLFRGHTPLGWPKGGYPAPQGPFYCGVGADETFGRELVEAHAKACLDAGLMLYGTNAEVMPGQWEFQIGYRGVEGESADPLTVSDHLWLARYLLYRLGEGFNIVAKLHPKPMKGDWNGAGNHTNFSTRSMRDPKTGMTAIKIAIDALQKAHDEHIKVYGADLEERLTGAHETCHISEFRAGVSDRGASVRIPRQVANNGYGYLEDRRPGANADPYEVSTVLMSTVCPLLAKESAGASA